MRIASSHGNLDYCNVQLEITNFDLTSFIDNYTSIIRFCDRQIVSNDFSPKSKTPFSFFAEVQTSI